MVEVVNEAIGAIEICIVKIVWLLRVMLGMVSEMGV